MPETSAVFATVQELAGIGDAGAEWDDSSGSDTVFSDNGAGPITSGAPFPPTLGSNFLYARGFNFASVVPSGATIDGVEVVIDANIQGPLTSFFAELWVGDHSTGNIITSSTRNLGALATQNGLITMGDFADNWGGNVTAADVRDTDFGVRFSVVHDVDSNITIDYVTIKIYYTTSGGGSGTLGVKLGSTTINKLMLGAIEINKAYLGSTIVYEKGGAPSLITTSRGGHWQDDAGNQIPTTSWAGFNMAAEIDVDANSGLTKPNDSTIQVEDAMPAAVSGGKARLFVANIKLDTSHNNRGNFQFRFALVGGTGSLFSTHASGYVRNTSNKVTWIRVIGVLADSSANAQVQLQWRRSSQSVTMVTLQDVSDLQCQEIWYDAIGIYSDTGGDALGGTTRNTVPLDTTVLESDTNKIERTLNDVAMKQNETKYLVLGSVAGASGGSRTQRISNFAYDGTPRESTQVYAYQRNSANPYAGMALFDMYDSDEVTVNASMQCYRGAGVAANQGGADVDGSWSSTNGFNQMCVIALPSTAKGFISADGTGAQTLGGSTTSINGMRTASLEDTDSYSRSSNINMFTNEAHRMLCWSNVFTARSNITSGVRGNIGSRILLDASPQTTGEHGNYTRGNQGSQDCFAGSFNAGGVFNATLNGAVVVQTFDAGDNGAGDDTQPNSAGFFALNLDSTAPDYT